MGLHSRIIAVAGVIAAYMILMIYIGFTLSTLAFVFVNPIVMGYKKYKVLALYSVVLTVALILVFGKIFYVPLPRGIGFLREISYYIY